MELDNTSFCALRVIPSPPAIDPSWPWHGQGFPLREDRTRHVLFREEAADKRAVGSRRVGPVTELFHDGRRGPPMMQSSEVCPYTFFIAGGVV